ncbi:MAG TPA: polyprenyl synthetase family protein [Syntrophomonas sp.]|nr:polyprenyl synthetase family protein [Syntrophomonas sp.]
MAGFELFQHVAEELEQVEKQLLNNIQSDLSVLENASAHLVKAGGKRLRPAFALLSAKLFSNSLERVIQLATALELIHMATLVHDDVIDNSSLRRGQETVKSAWGNRMSIYAGNFVFARALLLVESYHRSDIVDVLADASMRICEGEIQQMLSCYNTRQGLKDYLHRIERKTALLISVSCQLGAMVMQAAPREVTALKRYGYYLGMAFQLTDDILDFTASEEVLGKPVGSDIRQGVITLPSIYAIKFDPRGQELSNLLSSPECCRHRAEEIIDIVVHSEGIEYAYQVTQKYADLAIRQLQFLPDGLVCQALADMAGFISGRDY